MGTVVSLTVEGDEIGDVDLAHVEAIFAQFDSSFSLYSSASELSRIAAGELDLVDATAQVRETYALALDWRESTHGDFTPHRPDGVIDLSGIVKAMAMARAGADLKLTGLNDWCLNVGGDVLTSGQSHAEEPWVVGIIDPHERSTLLAATAMLGDRRACATSGSAERGEHIWTVGALPAAFVQATVVADDIVTADVLATAIIAGGPGALDRVCSSWDVDAMTIDRDGNIRMTPNFATREPSRQ